MEEFIQWANNAESIDPIIKAAIVPLWFVTIHPFTDGNGRLSRTLTDMFLTRSDGMIHRFYSMSATFSNHRSEYYDMLERTQHGGMDITPWIAWFLACMEEALQHTEQVIAKVVSKGEYWERHKEMPINERQRKVINRLLDGFEGKLTSSKWAKLVKCSSDTALRDIEDLLQKGLLVKEGTGRGTYYELKP
jgi:Fic family protein